MKYKIIEVKPGVKYKTFFLSPWRSTFRYFYTLSQADEVIKSLKEDSEYPNLYEQVEYEI